MPIEILAVARIDGRKFPKQRDTLAIARTIMDECVPMNPPTPADELALMVLLEKGVYGGWRVNDVTKAFGLPAATIQGVIRRAEKAGRVKRVKVATKIVYVRLSARGIQERRRRRGSK